MTASGKKAQEKKEWAPRIWEGCNFFAWSKLLVRNRFAVSFSLLYVAFSVTIVSVFHTVLSWMQDLFFGADIKAVRLSPPPLFILGHWRTGTTLLHELLILDERHSFPTYYECLAPNHFLLSEQFISRWFRFLMPSKRPMDNMQVGWDRPQEDEFALCMLGQPSPYLTIAFPNRPPQDQEAFDLERLPERRLASWKRTFVRFLKSVAFKNPRKRLILKSPTHSCRIKTLLELFPDALFVHIVRNPYVVFPSTMNLWKTLYETHGLQKPTLVGLQDYVFDTFIHMYDKLEEGKRLVPANRFYQVRYEDLVRDPIAEMRRLYDHLRLDDYDRVLPRLEEYLAKTSGYQTNKYERSPQVRAEITRRWGEIARRYGYEEPGETPQ